MPLRFIPLAGLLLLAGTASAAPPLLVASKVQRVLVYSNQAQVFRSATLSLGAEPVTASVASLPAAAMLETVRVDCPTAEVQRVELTRTRQQLPRQKEAAELAAKIEQALLRLRAIADERRWIASELDLVNALQLQRPRRTDRSPPDGIFVDAWRRLLAWVEARASRGRARLLVLAGEEKQQGRELHALRVQSQGLDLEAVATPVPQVLVTLKGAPGRHQLTVSYLVSGVRWVPTYDLGYDHRNRTVEAATYALLGQTTGEDWPSAQLQFSTGQPVHLMAVPELPTWTLGRQRDFEPKPRPRTDPPPPQWIAPDLTSAASDAAVERLLGALAEAESLADLRSAERQRPAKEAPPRDKDDDSRRLGDLEPSPPGQKARPTGFSSAITRTSPDAPSVPPPPAPMEVSEQALEPEAVSISDDRVSGRLAGAPARSSVSHQKPAEVLPWTEQGYRPPPVDPNSPAAAAQGYLYVLHAPGRHSVAATGAAQRIPLSRQRFKIDPVYKIRPGLNPAAYLTAGFTNNTGKPILRGHANLFAGSMFTGRTWLNTALPGRPVLLPLGVDDSVQVVRHLRQKTATSGVVFKDDATDYTVAIEIANHRGYPIKVELEDQIPIKEGDKVEIRNFSGSGFKKPDRDGKVSWQGSVGASSVKKLEFSFQIVRPKDWELQQHD